MVRDLYLEHYFESLTKDRVQSMSAKYVIYTICTTCYIIIIIIIIVANYTIL